jgi:hydrogenase maturation protein HypF
MKSQSHLHPSVRVRLALHGAVQGVGFRPFVHRLATELSLTGWVNNSPQGVFVEAESPRPALEQFIRRLQMEKPPRSFIQSLETTWLDAVGFNKFEIRASETSGDKTALVLPDIATCPDCLREIFNPRNRRFRYPFTNCTNCGPRFSIIESLPYDRTTTSMKKFAMCPACQAEYDSPQDRRFHAQPNACPVCGPRLELWSATGEVIFGGNQALLAAAQMIRRGKIVAVKGVGGFHLVVDARNEKSVRRLRERKHREEKPFALMFPGISAVKCICEVSAREERLLRSSEAPIVLLAKIKNRKSNIADGVAPGNPNLGVLLPSNPLHHLLLLELDFPVVATSGNLNDEPICTDEREALDRLRGIADVFLVHDRPIVRHVDDSIVRVMLDREMILRRARGYAPLPITVAAGILPAVEPGFQPGGKGIANAKNLRIENNPSAASLIPGGRMPAATILAVGAHLKNAVALAVGGNVFISQHIGDLETAEADDTFRRVIPDFERLYDAKPEIVAADLHPDYLSTKYARDSGKTLFGVQHHVAHVLSCMAENEIQLPALGVAWDGTGYGIDGTIWGGEFFLVRAGKIERVAHLRPFRLPGGDKAVMEPRRAAIGLLYELYGEAAFEMDQLAPFQKMPAVAKSALKRMLQRRLNSPATSSAGRLFDAVASLANLRQTMQFEGHAAMELEFALDGVNTDDAYSLSLIPHHPSLVLDWSLMIHSILADVNGGVSAAEISAKFHNALAEAVVAIAQRIGEPRVALSGGCFQNLYLAGRIVTRLRAENFQPFWHQRVPPNDGGIALGQVFAALNNLTLN